MSLLQNSNAISSGGYNIANSLRFQSASSQYLSRTPASVSNQSRWTWAGWVKRGKFGTTFPNDYNYFLFGAAPNSSAQSVISYSSSTNSLSFYIYNGTTFLTNIETNAVFRDPSAWYHVVFVFDSANATAADRAIFYINGVRQTTNTTASTSNGYINGNVAHTIGTDARLISPNGAFDGYMTEVNFIDGQALTPSSFGETNTLTGQWVAKKYTGTYGTNGFYLPFSNGTSTTTLGYDSSGNGNNWTLTNFTRSAGTTDCWMYDVPSGNGSVVSGTQPNSNYAVLNPLSNAVAPVNANLRMSASTGNYSGLASMTMPSGKWYWECVNTGGSVFPMFGIARASLAANVGFWTSSLGYAYYYDGTKYNASTPTSYGASYTANDIIGVAFDADAGTLTFYKNNVSQGVAFTGLTQGDYCPAIGQGSGVLVINNINFGQRSFAYTPPSGFKALCTANLPASTIVKGNQFMDATTYTGNSSTQNIVNAAGFSPDLVWIKSRSGALVSYLSDTVRGAYRVLFSSLTNAEYDGTSFNDGVSAFNSNGFTLLNGSNVGNYNQSGSTYVAWQWDAGSSTVTNTSGTISSQVRANPTAGVSVVTYTGNGTSGATVGHGLGVAPSMIIVKGRSTTSNWPVYHASIPNTQAVLLNTTAAAAGIVGTYWNSTSPTSSVFSLGGVNSGNNTSSATYVAYCFAEIAGFSKFGSYTGNGSTDGPMVWTGFTPRYVMIKQTNGANDWWVMDTARDPYNVGGAFLSPNLSNAESSGNVFWDALSNGFKLRNVYSQVNGNGNTYIYMAFASNPFSASNAR